MLSMRKHTSRIRMRQEKVRHALRGIMLCVCFIGVAFHSAKADPLSSAASGMFGMMGSMANFMAQMVSPGSSWMPPNPMYGIYPNSPPAYGTPYSAAPSWGSNRQLPGTASTGSSSFWLNGQWHATTGEVLQISGKNFILVSREGTLVGYVTSNEDLLSFYIPKINQSLLFKVKLLSNRLSLTGPNGKVLTFNKSGM